MRFSHCIQTPETNIVGAPSLTRLGATLQVLNRVHPFPKAPQCRPNNSEVCGVDRNYEPRAELPEVDSVQSLGVGIGRRAFVWCGIRRMVVSGLCRVVTTWWEKYKQVVDELVCHSNVHSCTKNQSHARGSNGNVRPSCINKYGQCKARFPRQLYSHTEVDIKTGALNIKKGEAWINTFTPLVTYLL